MKHQITTEYINNLYETIVRPNNNNFSENLAKSKKQVIFVFLGYFLFNFLCTIAQNFSSELCVLEAHQDFFFRINFFILLLIINFSFSN